MKFDTNTMNTNEAKFEKQIGNATYWAMLFDQYELIQSEHKDVDEYKSYGILESSGLVFWELTEKMKDDGISQEHFKAAGLEWHGEQYAKWCKTIDDERWSYDIDSYLHTTRGDIWVMVCKSIKHQFTFEQISQITEETYELLKEAIKEQTIRTQTWSAKSIWDKLDELDFGGIWNLLVNMMAPDELQSDYDWLGKIDDAICQVVYKK